mgnify:CR=1 FL=1
MQLAHRGQAPAKGILHIERREPVKLAEAQGLLDGPVHGFWLGYHAASQEKRARRFAMRILGRRQVLKTAKYEKRNGPI